MIHFLRVLWDSQRVPNPGNMMLVHPGAVQMAGFSFQVFAVVLITGPLRGVAPVDLLVRHHLPTSHTTTNLPFRSLFLGLLVVSKTGCTKGTVLSAGPLGSAVFAALGWVGNRAHLAFCGFGTSRFGRFLRGAALTRRRSSNFGGIGFKVAVAVVGVRHDGAGAVFRRSSRSSNGRLWTFVVVFFRFVQVGAGTAFL